MRSTPGTPEIDDVISRASELTSAFRRAGLPVVLVNVEGGAPGRKDVTSAKRKTRADGWTALIPELDAQAGDRLVAKRTWGAFTGTDLADFLASRSVTQVVLTGVATSIGVESTARQAHERGLNVALVVDAMTDSSPEAHHNSTTRIFPRLDETGTTAEILELVAAVGAPA